MNLDEVIDRNNRPKYVLTWGIHKGTLMSRDDGYPKEFFTKDEAIAEFHRLQANFINMGYTMWYAQIRDIDTGEILETLASNCNYSR
jgi:hypothetical protein